MRYDYFKLCRRLVMTYFTIICNIVEMNLDYKSILQSHFNEHSQIAVLSGPRPIGKTTLARSLFHIK